MRLKASVVKVSVVLITSLIITSPSFGEDNRLDGKNQNSKQGENFTPVGVRSHGVPTREWTPNSAQPSTMSLNGPSVNQDQNGSDDSWNAQAFSKNQASARTYAVGATAPNPISCHGSCTVLGSTNVAIIPVWVGSWDSTKLTSWNNILGNLINTYGNSKPTNHIFNTNVKYFSSINAMPTLNWVAHSSVVNLKSPTATSVSDRDVSTYLNTFISAKNVQVPPNSIPVYVYIGSSNTRLSSGFGTSYCGWHTYGTTSNNSRQPYIAIQDFDPKKYSGCTYQQVSPNSNVALDAMASVLAHEIDETITDPYLNAWYDARGAENADKCAWTFGATQNSGGSLYNFTSGSYKYLIQQNWLADNKVTSTGTSTGTACSVTGN